MVYFSFFTQGFLQWILHSKLSVSILSSTVFWSRWWIPPFLCGRLLSRLALIDRTNHTTAGRSRVWARARPSSPPIEKQRVSPATIVRARERLVRSLALKLEVTRLLSHRVCVYLYINTLQKRDCLTAVSLAGDGRLFFVWTCAFVQRSNIMSASAAKVSKKDPNSNHDGADETSGK